MTTIEEHDERVALAEARAEDAWKMAEDALKLYYAKEREAREARAARERFELGHGPHDLSPEMRMREFGATPSAELLDADTERLKP